jgi:hypothetical protein
LRWVGSETDQIRGLKWDHETVFWDSYQALHSQVAEALRKQGINVPKDVVDNFKDANVDTLWDFSVSELKTLPKYDSPYSAHIAQINIYRWLLGLDPSEVTMEIVYFNMEGVKTCRLKDGTQPGRGNRAPTNQHWSDEDVERYLDDRLLKLKASFMTDIPLPYDLVTEDEKWECEYCPVRAECAKQARDEQEAAWRKRAGLPPAGTPADPSPLWEALLEDIRNRTSDSSVSPTTNTAVVDAETRERAETIKRKARRGVAK